MTYKICQSDRLQTGHLLTTAQLWRVSDLLADTRLIPASPGLYAFWFDVALGVVAPASHRQDAFGFAYVGIAGGRGGGTLRRRLRQHLKGPCRSSTLRRALASILVEDLNLQAALSPVGKLLLLGDGESKLSAWLTTHARVSWVEHPAPAALERAVLEAFAPPLNIDGAPSDGAQVLKAARARLRERAGGEV